MSHAKTSPKCVGIVILELIGSSPRKCPTMAARVGQRQGDQKAKKWSPHILTIGSKDLLLCIAKCDARIRERGSAALVS